MSVLEVKSLQQLTSIPEYTTGLLVVNFWAAWSEPSKQMNTVLEQLAKQYPQIKFAQVEAEEVDDVTEKFKIESVPTTVFLKNGSVIETLKGANPPELTKRVSSFSQYALTTTTTSTASGPQPPPPTKQDAKEALNKRLHALINQDKIMAFIKGTPEAPQCGFSAKFCKLLKDHNISFSYFNILEDEEVRQGLKVYSNWPTYPQLYINGKLIGGLDIVKELLEEGELQQMVKEALK